jgi:hypothetical protein
MFGDAVGVSNSNRLWLGVLGALFGSLLLAAAAFSIRDFCLSRLQQHRGLWLSAVAADASADIGDQNTSNLQLDLPPLDCYWSANCALLVAATTQFAAGLVVALLLQTAVKLVLLFQWLSSRLVLRFESLQVLMLVACGRLGVLQKH